MPSEVKMPQLGMNQDSAVIVSWLKGAGDRISAGEAIFEVETDKATVEVEAAVDGYLSDIQAPEGADVPVGDVIARIVDSENDVVLPDTADAAPEPVAEPAPNPPHEPEAKEVNAPDNSKIVPPARPAGKILASPLAKRLASEQGLDLAGLRASGVTEPIHAADLKLVSVGGRSVLTARVDGGALTALLDRSEDANRSRLFAAFAAGAWCAVHECATTGIEIRGVDGTIMIYPDETSDVALTLIDLCDTRLGSFVPATGGITLVAAREGETFALTLTFSNAILQFPTAVALLDAIAARVEDPIRQLL